MKVSNTKIVTVSLLLSDLQKNRVFFKIPESVTSEDSLKDYLLERYKTDTGILEGFIDNKRIILQWYPDDVDEEAEQLHSRALQFAKNKQYLNAIASWEKAVHLNPGDVEYLYKVGLVYFEVRKFVEAVQFLEKAIHICPIHYRANLLLGIALIKLRKFDTAEKYILDSNMLNRSNTLTYLNLGAIYSIQKRFNEAIDMFNSTIKLAPNESRAYLGLAKIYMMLSDIDASNGYLRKVIEIAPGTSMAEYAKRTIQIANDSTKEMPAMEENREERFSKGMNAYLSGDYPTAAIQYKAYLNIHPSDDYAWYLFGETRMRIGDLGGAADCFKRAIRINGKRGLYYKTLGIVFYLTGKSREGEQVTKKAMELGKQDPLNYTLMGIHMLREKKVDEAMNCFQHALRRNPNNPLALYHVALAYIQKEDKGKASRIIDEILGFSYFVPLKQQAKNLMGKLDSKGDKS